MKTPLTSLSPQQQIERAALSLFSEKGYSGTTMAEIAARAGVNPAVIYRYFSSKQQLFETLQRPDLNFPDQQEQQRRNEIMQVALRVFSQKGYSAATMDDIADAAGLSKAGVYFYYPSKEALFAAALENPAGFAILDPILADAFSDPHSGLEEGLTRLAAGYLSLFENEEFTCLLRIILSEGVRNPEVASAFKEKIVKRGAENVAQFLARFSNLPPDLLIPKVQMFFGMLFTWGLTNRLLIAPFAPAAMPLQTTAREYVRQFLYGFQSHSANHSEVK